MASGELIAWADKAGSEMLWHIQEYQKTGNMDSVLEVQHAVTELHAVVDELYTDCVSRSMIT